MPVFALALVYWFHLTATVIWFGGLVVVVFAGFETQANTLFDSLERRMRPWTNLGLAVLLLTGIIQMGADEHYEGLLKMNSAWTVGLLLKHIIIGGILVISGVMQWSVRPTLERTRLLARRSTDNLSEETQLRRRLHHLSILNLGLGLLVLLFTAIITAL